MAAPLSDPAVFDTDVAVIGSGFGGSVTALRLAEKNYIYNKCFYGCSICTFFFKPKTN